MEILLASHSWQSTDADLTVVALASGKRIGLFQEMDRAMEGAWDRLLSQDGFDAKEGEWGMIATLGRLETRRLGVLGVGDRSKVTTDTWRKIGALLVRRSREVKAKNVSFVLEEALFQGKDASARLTALFEGVCLGAYRFHAYKEKEAKEALEKDVKTVTVLAKSKALATQAAKALEAAKNMASGVCLARDLVNTPSADLFPEKMAEVAKSLVKKGNGVTVRILDQKEMEKLGMHAALAVGRGSQLNSVGVHLVYKPAKAKKKIAIVGKAVTFDSGGLSIKPADGMMTMKIDMGGAATVLGLFKALPLLDVDVEVHGIFLAVENMPSGSAYRPGDVVRAKNGVAIEVLNTDAEGRVTLADALSYAVDLKPDAIVDLATLTGACVVALGEDIAALLTNNRKLGDGLLASAKHAGEELWELPLYAPYQDLIKSKVGDIKNIGGRSAGTITAALFLQHFVAEMPWAHLDIAGPVYAEKESRPENPFGGTGYGVRTLAEWLRRGA